MLKRFSYNKKNKYLIALAILLPFILYVFAIKKTVLAYNEFEKNSIQLDSITQVPVLYSKLKKELDFIDQQLGAQDIGHNYLDSLIEAVTNYCQVNSIILKEFPKTNVIKKDNLIVETNKIVLEGDFISLLKFVYLLENKRNYGKVVSVYYQSKMDYRTNKFNLTSTVYLQNIKKTSDEN